MITDNCNIGSPNLKASLSDECFTALPSDGRPVSPDYIAGILYKVRLVDVETALLKMAAANKIGTYSEGGIPFYYKRRRP